MPEHTGDGEIVEGEYKPGDHVRMRLLTDGPYYPGEVLAVSGSGRVRVHVAGCGVFDLNANQLERYHINKLDPRGLDLIANPAEFVTSPPPMIPYTTDEDIRSQLRVIGEKLEIARGSLLFATAMLEKLRENLEPRGAT